MQEFQILKMIFGFFFNATVIPIVTVWHWPSSFSQKKYPSSDDKPSILLPVKIMLDKKATLLDSNL